MAFPSNYNPSVSLIASLFHIIHETLKKSILVLMTSNLFSLDDLGKLSLSFA